MKILCYKNSKLGDYLITLPSIKLIKKKIKNAKFTIYQLKVNFIKIYQKNLKKLILLMNLSTLITLL